ncbi:NUDIX domain-containing protein, partial [Micrococcus luteus]
MGSGREVLTTIGGRLEENESIQEGLEREALEEAGIELAEIRIPFASWFWKETN